jgi:putative ABC transport system permease protein
MRGDVALARRSLLSDSRRVVVSVLGVGLAIALMLLVQGLWSGTLSRITSYEDLVGADLFVAERGTKAFASDISVIPPGSEAVIRGIPDVVAADPVVVRQLIVEAHSVKVPVVLVGADADGLGGPWRISQGRAIGGSEEVVLDDGFAAAHGYAVGGSMQILGRDLRIVGLAPDSRALGNGGWMFVSLGDARELVGSEGSSFVLVRTQEPITVANQIRSQLDLEALTPEALAEGDRALYDDTMGSVVRVMLATAFAAGTLIVALSVYSSIVERIRDYGILKALGADRRRLLRVIVSQTGSLSVLGTIVGLGGFLVAKQALAAWLPQYHVELQLSTVAAATGTVLQPSSLWARRRPSGQERRSSSSATRATRCIRRVRSGHRGSRPRVPARSWLSAPA